MVLAKAFQRVPRPMLLLPIQSGPEMVYRALGPYVDGFWVRVPKTEDALRIYNAAHKPLVVSDALTADPDSPWYFKAKIDSIHFDAATGNTVIYAPELRYVFRTAQSVAFPDCAELMERGTCAEKFIDAFPRVKSAHWNVLAVPGDFTPAVKPGMRVEMWKQGKYPYACSTQAQRARDMVRRYQSLLDLQGDDGMNFVMGIEHWCLYDPAVSNWVDNENFGLATLQDNAYDGVEARQQTGLDARGYPVGGEETDYGNVIEELSAFLREVDNLLQRR
jgi:hypothetical protein